MTTLWLNDVEIPQLSENEVLNIYIDKTNKGSFVLNGKIFEYCGFKRVSKLDTSEYHLYLTNNGLLTGERLIVEIKPTKIRKFEEALFNLE